MGVGCRRNPSGEHQGNDDLLAFPYIPAGFLLKMRMLVLKETAVTDVQTPTVKWSTYTSTYVHTHIHILTILSP